MPFRDFREFLDALRTAGELLELERAVSSDLEVAKAMRKSASVSGGWQEYDFPELRK
jgi:4-hydroxy-3-polyprenylbenzoate decarboxylase/2,5-furandicarboxylate decarboxylase 1